MSKLSHAVTIHFDSIAAALSGPGWLLVPNFLPPSVCSALLADCHQRRTEFVAAAVGRGQARQQLSDQRSDTTLWLSDSVDVQREFLQALDALRAELNRRLYLGLRDCEAHYAHYAPGAFYRRHRDAFAHARSSTDTLKGTSAPQRILTGVMYLNTCAGGELALWNDDGEIARIAPCAGSAVFFLSADFPHEVLPAQADRYSIACWFRG